MTTIVYVDSNNYEVEIDSNSTNNDCVHSRFNTWLQWVGLRQQQSETRNLLNFEN